MVRRAVILLAILVVACQSPPPPAAAPSPSPSGVRGGTLVMGDFEWPATLDPLRADTEAELRVTGLLYEPLWTFDPELRPVPRLLASMPVPEVGRDGTMSLDLKLRQGLRWSDGSALTADDVVAATTAASTPVTSQVRRSATEVVWRFATVDPAWRLLGPRIIPQRPNAVSGPFEIAGQVPGSEIRLAANPLYAAGRASGPWLQGITFRFYGGKAAEIAAIQDGQVDLGFHLLPDDLSQLTTVAGARAVVKPSLRGEMLVPNHSQGPWSGDSALLPALGMGIDREALNAQVFDGEAAVSHGLYPAQLLQYDAGFGASSPDQARSALEADGWAPGADQVRSKAGRRLAFTLLAPCDDQVRQGEQAELVRQFARLGAVATPTCEPRASFFSVLSQGGFQLALFSNDWQPDPSAWASLPDFGHCQTEQLKQTLATGARTLDARVRRAAYRDAAGEWLKIPCTFPLLQWPSVVTVTMGTHGFQPNPVAGLDSWDAAGWWLSG